MQSLIVILGPTGVGKTELCLTIAEHLNCEIINCDSRQIFKNIPIGTAAPTVEQLQRVRHHFVGNLPLNQYYSASEYEHDVLQLLKESNEETFILSGGSMMYIDAICNGIDEMPTIADELRTKLKDRLENEGLPSLVEELHHLDSQYWEKVDRKNPRRILHALEICIQTGKPYSSFMNAIKKKRPFNIIKIGLTRPREELYERINARVLTMVEDGLIEEARSVYHMRHCNSLNTVGYKEMFDYLDGKIDRNEAIRQIQSNSRRYMRKQETWFKRDTSITWFNPSEVKEIIKFIDNSLYKEKND